ncbi:hypothetical protein ACU686_38535 [Yinghuangia aomiensis]
MEKGAAVHGVAGTLTRAAQVTETAQALYEEAERLPRLRDDVTKRLSSLRTRAQAVASRADNPEPALHRLRRPSSAACWTDIADAPQKVTQAVAVAEARIDEVGQAAGRQEWADAVSRLATARAALNQADEAMAAVHDRLRDLDARRRGPGSGGPQRTRFAVRDAQRLAVGDRAVAEGVSTRGGSTRWCSGSTSSATGWTRRIRTAAVPVGGQGDPRGGRERRPADPRRPRGRLTREPNPAAALPSAHERPLSVPRRSARGGREFRHTTTDKYGQKPRGFTTARVNSWRPRATDPARPQIGPAVLPETAFKVFDSAECRDHGPSRQGHLPLSRRAAKTRRRAERPRPRENPHPTPPFGPWCLAPRPRLPGDVPMPVLLIPMLAFVALAAAPCVAALRRTPKADTVQKIPLHTPDVNELRRMMHTAHDEERDLLHEQAVRWPQFARPRPSPSPTCTPPRAASAATASC